LLLNLQSTESFHDVGAYSLTWGAFPHLKRVPYCTFNLNAACLYVLCTLGVLCKGLCKLGALQLLPLCIGICNYPPHPSADSQITVPPFCTGITNSN